MTEHETEQLDREAGIRRAAEAARARIKAEIPPGVELDEDERTYLAREGFDTNGITLASILRKVREAGQEEGRTPPARDDLRAQILPRQK